MCEEKRIKICLIPAPAGPNINNFEVAGGRPILFIMIVAGGKAENVVNSGTMDKFSNPPAGGRNSRLFNLCIRFFKAFFNYFTITIFFVDVNDEDDKR